MYLCHFLFGPIIVQMRRTDAWLRCTDAHNFTVHCNDGYGWFWWIYDGNYACFMVFGWVLDGFEMVFGWFRIDFDGFWRYVWMDF